MTKITRKWDRWQHHVDYRPFAGNPLRLKPDSQVPVGTDEFGMTIEPIA